MSFKITVENDYFLILFIDNFDRKLMSDAYESLVNRSDFTKQSNTMWDFSQVVVDLSYNCIQTISESLTKYCDKRSNTARSAFVVFDPSDKAILQTYGLY